MKRSIAALALSLLASSSVAFAQAADPPLPEEARKRLDYAIGKWHSRTESIGRDGEVRGTSSSDDERRFVIGDRVIEISGVDNKTGRSFRAWEYYDPQVEKYCLTSIAGNGRLVTMKGDLGDLFRWTSDDMERSDGTTLAMRFTHTDYTPNSFTALGEFSLDSGETWIAFSRQYMTRKPDLAADTKTLHGSYVWTGAGESSAGDLEAIFTATDSGEWNVTFHFEHRGKPHVYTGTAVGSLTDGDLEGKVKNADKLRNFTFTGSFKAGVFRGTHTEVGRGRKDRIEETGTMILKP